MPPDRRPFDPCMTDRHPWVQVTVGMTRHGKSTYIATMLSRWHGVSFALDGVAPNPPLHKHIARWATMWAESPPEQWPHEVDLVACDEAPLFPITKGSQMEAVVLRGQHTGHRGTSCILGAQRAKLLDRRVWSQASRVVIFRQRDEYDLEQLATLPGMTRQALSYIPELPPGFAVVWDSVDGLFIPYIPEWHQVR